MEKHEKGRTENTSKGMTLREILSDVLLIRPDSKLTGPINKVFK